MLKKFQNFSPDIKPDTYVAESAEIIGKVVLEKGVSVWPKAVLRGDVEHIIIGENTNLQDNCVLHTNYDLPVKIGKNVTVGHSAIIHGSNIADNCLIGMGAILLDACELGLYTIVAAGALVPEAKVLEPYSVYMGMPAKKIRGIKDVEKELIQQRALEYVELASMYMEKGE